MRRLSAEDVHAFTEEDLAGHRFERIRRYFEIILKENADLVLFAGDVTGDGFCGHGFHHAFLVLLTLLEQRKIPSFFISGNHDPPEYYDVVKDWTSDFQYTSELSGKITSISDLTILGVNYDCAKSKRSLKRLIEESPDKIDIVVAHSQIKRRIRHFDLRCNYLFTGHYDRKLFAHRDTVFVAMDNDSEEVSYAVLNRSDGKIALKIRKNEEVTFSYVENVVDLLAGNRNSILNVNDRPTFDLIRLENASDESLSRDGDHYLYLKYVRGMNYQASLETMFKLGNKIPLDVGDLSLNQIHNLPITANYKISERMIEDYLGNVI